MEQKILDAIAYIERRGIDEETLNDAANIYADNIAEYSAIWDAIEAFLGYSI